MARVREVSTAVRKTLQTGQGPMFTSKSLVSWKGTFGCHGSRGRSAGRDCLLLQFPWLLFQVTWGTVFVI